MTSTAPKMGLAITALACVALTITSLGPASATPAASVAQAERAPEPAATSGGLLYRPSRAEFTALREVPGAALTAHLGLNDHGQITGTYENPNDTPSRQRTGGATASRERGDHLMTSTPPQGSSGSAAERGRSQASPRHGQDGAQT